MRFESFWSANGKAVVNASSTLERWCKHCAVHNDTVTYDLYCNFGPACLIVGRTEGDELLYSLKMMLGIMKQRQQIQLISAQAFLSMVFVHQLLYIYAIL